VRAALEEKSPTDSTEVYIRMGQVGPRTLLKWRMRGMRLVRKRVSIMTAAFVSIVVLGRPVERAASGLDIDFGIVVVVEGFGFCDNSAESEFA